MHFLTQLTIAVQTYLEHVAPEREHLALLRWQIGQGHALDDRSTMPGHLTTSAFVLSSDRRHVLLIDHVRIKRWLQPGGHYEPANYFWQSAAREAVEETGVQGLMLHAWHGGGDLPFLIDSHDVPGNAAKGEVAHVHHDLQYLFTADPAMPLVPQIEEVHAAQWEPLAALEGFAPRALRRIGQLGL